MRLVRLAVLALLFPGFLAAAEVVKKFGEPLTDMTAKPLTQILTAPEDGARVRVEGEITKVCQKKGCWLELKDGDASVHVTFAGYAFFVPKDSTGSNCVLEGKLVVKQPDPDTVEHLKGEGAGEAAASKVSIEASGVEIRARVKPAE